MASQSFGHRIRDRRKHEGWSQEELAGKAGISRNYLSQIERGVATNLSWQVVERLSAVLGLAASEIREEAGSYQTLPPGLAKFAEGADIPRGDVEMLARVRYRGKQPTTVEEWRLLYNAIKIAMGEA